MTPGEPLAFTWVVEGSPTGPLLRAELAAEARCLSSAVFGGGLLLATLQGAYLRTAAPQGVRRIVHLLAAAAAATSLAYCAVYAVGLTDLVVTTIEQGADR